MKMNKKQNIKTDQACLKRKQLLEMNLITVKIIKIKTNKTLNRRSQMKKYLVIRQIRRR